MTTTCRNIDCKLYKLLEYQLKIYILYLYMVLIFFRKPLVFSLFKMYKASGYTSGVLDKEKIFN